jgi:hypothetical protein
MSTIDMDSEFDMLVTFDYRNMNSTNGQTGMKVVVSQKGNQVTIYNGTAAQGSKSLDGNDLVSTMNDGYWLVVSYWQGFSPDKWYQYGADGGPCKQWSSLDATSWWTIGNVHVIGDQV